ncbi:hypothetical protein [Streptomyces sp. NBC_01187]|uniref:hypothetical protein n=1 Tax=Streptomyces sp. NBC_01187 TaxID=2903766 RepID=UPI00386D9BA2|nr:hypothetical protein OG220_11730 [Streptomyces sp. NBC_01187]
MNTLTPSPVGYVVVGEVLLGPQDTPVLAKSLFCSIECAAEGVRKLTAQLARSERSSALVTWSEERPVGVVVTGGRMWVVQIHASHEL